MRYRSCCCCAACCTYPICPVQVVARCQQDTRSWFFSVYISNPLPLRTTFDTIRVPGTFFLLVFCCLVNWMNLPHPDWNKRPHFFIRFLSRYRPLSCFRVHRLDRIHACAMIVSPMSRFASSASALQPQSVAIVAARSIQYLLLNTMVFCSTRRYCS